MSFDYAAIKSALKEAGHLVSEGEQWLASDFHELYVFAKAKFGLDEKQTAYGLAYPAELPSEFPGHPDAGTEAPEQVNTARQIQPLVTPHASTGVTETFDTSASGSQVAKNQARVDATEANAAVAAAKDVQDKASNNGVLSHQSAAPDANQSIQAVGALTTTETVNRAAAQPSVPAGASPAETHAETSLSSLVNPADTSIQAAGGQTTNESIQTKYQQNPEDQAPMEGDGMTADSKADGEAADGTAENAVNPDAKSDEDAENSGLDTSKPSASTGIQAAGALTTNESLHSADPATPENVATSPEDQAAMQDAADEKATADQKAIDDTPQYEAPKTRAFDQEPATPSPEPAEHSGDPLPADAPAGDAEVHGSQPPVQVAQEPSSDVAAATNQAAQEEAATKADTEVPPTTSAGVSPEVQEHIAASNAAAAEQAHQPANPVGDSLEKKAE